jgi:ribosome-associated translation inhibitor RaiA
VDVEVSVQDRGGKEQRVTLRTTVPGLPPLVAVADDRDLTRALGEAKRELIRQIDHHKSAREPMNKPSAPKRDDPASETTRRVALIARFRLVRDPVLPHAWSVFHCVATPRIPVHHAHEPPIGGKLPSYFLLKRLTQSFPLEWRDVLRYRRLRKLHADLHAAHCAPLLTLRGHSVQRRQLIATWSMGVPVLSAMYSRAIGSTSLG